MNRYTERGDMSAMEIHSVRGKCKLWKALHDTKTERTLVSVLRYVHKIVECGESQDNMLANRTCWIVCAILCAGKQLPREKLVDACPLFEFWRR